MRYFFINKYYHPDLSATSQKLTELLDYIDLPEIHVITNRYLYNADTRLARTEEYNNIIVHRVFSTRSGVSIFSKALCSVTFYFSVFIFLVVQLKKNDIVIAKTDPPLMSVILLPLIKIKAARLVNWLQDLFPEVAIRLNYPLLSGWLGRLLIRLRNFSLNKSIINIAVSEDMKSYLVKSGVSCNKVSVIHNWCQDRISAKQSDSPIRQSLPLDKKIIMYAGNLGRAHDYHELEKLLYAMNKQETYYLAFYGGGIGFKYLQEIATKKNIRNVRFSPYVENEELDDLLNAADIHIISMKHGFQDCLMPSKLYCIINVQKPVLYIGDKTSELAKLVEENGLGIATTQINPESVMDTLGTLSHTVAPKKLQKEYNIGKSMQQWQSIMNLVSQ